MNKKIAIFVSALLCMLLAAMMCVSVSADTPAQDSADKVGKMTVVYLRDGGTGDGSDYANAVSTLEDAYMMLDLSKDCTIVVCDVFTQINATFSIGKENAYTGSVTFTSCYGGYDYRTIGAKFEFDPFRFLCWGETKFEYIEFHTPGTNLLVVGQHNPVTVGEEVKISGASMTGGSVAKAFCIVGGYQKQRNESDPAVPPMEDNRDTHITVMSGEFIYIVPFSRELGGNSYEGTAHVKIGGNAIVSVLHGSAIGSNTYVGDVEIEITDNAHIKNFYGSTHVGVNAKSITFNWKSGTIDRFEWLCSYSTNPELVVDGNRTLNASDDVKAADAYVKIATSFDVIGSAAKDLPYVPAQNPNTAKPGDDILKAPVTTTTPTPPTATDTTAAEDTTAAPDSDAAETTKAEKETRPVFTRAPRDSDSATTPEGNAGGNSDGDADLANYLPVIIGGAAALVVVAVVVVIIISKKKKAE